ncbi:MAG: type II toxin-antitoxin system RelE/ParE family toxin [Candidatus Margulisbacteria bacterium]|nr:type II toxin-antitoxin system RelE/ParE family toxin [Candidatus Margulisiibacteriota bacterium]
MYKIISHKSAEKKLDKLTQNWRLRIVKALDSIAYNPYIGKRLQGELEGCLRIRIGDLRIIYSIYEKEKIVIVHSIGSRGDIYK